MSSYKRMQPVAEAAQQQADAAAKSVAECNRIVMAMRRQLDELLGYRDDYANGLRQKGHKGVNASQMKDYSVFLERLNKAIGQQQENLDNAGARFAASKRVWIEKQQRAKAIDSVVERYQQADRREQSRREQQEGDEHARRLTCRQES
ncbi:MAG: flagellar export protein FliJ [Gammaproteobacteria bacterium]